MTQGLGKVYLVGAGPGAVDLITVRGSRLLAKADIVFHDALVDPEMLLLCPNAIQVAVGKRCGKISTAQHLIEDQLIEAAHQYSTVVRLKGGDPMMFGRADEELMALEKHCIEVEVVPGVTAALAAAASLKHSLTLRGVSRSVAFVTLARSQEVLDQSAPKSDHTMKVIAPHPVPNADTLVYYMGRKDSMHIAEQLLTVGRKSAVPVRIIEAISTKNERWLTLTLGEMAQGLAQPWFNGDSPALIMIGEALRSRQESSI